jgi:hypothetical protein
MLTNLSVSHGNTTLLAMGKSKDLGLGQFYNFVFKI